MNFIKKIPNALLLIGVAIIYVGCGYLIGYYQGYQAGQIDYINYINQIFQK